MNWYCIRTTTGRERVASERLKSFNIETLLPMARQKYIDRFDNLRERKCALFQGYLFAHCEREQYSLAASGWRREILKLVGFSDVPNVLPAEIISEIRGRLGPDDYVRLDDGLHVGADVMIAAGVWEGKVGKLFSEDPNERVTVLISLLGTETKVGFDRCRVVPALVV